MYMENAYSDVLKQGWETFDPPAMVKQQVL